jgi:uncharacterized membrane protein YfcA
MKKKIFKILGGFIAGLINGLFGAGGGLLLVPLLKNDGLSVRKAHATSIIIITILCAFSSLFYIKDDKSLALQALPFIIGGSIKSVGTCHNFHIIHI